MGRGLSSESRDLIAAAYKVLEREQPSGVRRVSYALYGNQASAHVKKLGGLLTRARKGGTIPWEWITDDTRPEREPFVVTDAASLRATNRACPYYDPWREQPTRVAVWSEKSVGGTLAPILDAYLVPFQVHHGNTSTSWMRRHAERTWCDPREFVILYVGDHDPKGLRISEDDIPKRIIEYGFARTTVKRIALLKADAVRLRSMRDAFKPGDLDVSWYQKRTRLSYGVELEAISSTDLRDRVKAAIDAEIADIEAWNRVMHASTVVRESWQTYADAWPMPSIA